MKEKNLPLDYHHRSLEDLTEEANRIIESLENENNLSNSVNSYQELLKLNNLIEKKFQNDLKSISVKSNNKIKEIKKKKWKMKLIKLQKIQILF